MAMSFGRAEAGRLSKVDERAAAATDAAAIATMNVEAALADAAAKLEAAKTASAAKAADLADAVRRLNDATAASDAAANAEKEALRRTSPLSVLVSKKDQRIYVRQGLAPVFDVPASVRDPERRSVRTFISRRRWKAMGLRSNGRSCRSQLGLPRNGANVRGKRPWSRNRSGHCRNCTGPLRAPPMRSSASRLPRTFATGSRSVCGQAARSSFPTSRSAERRAPLAPTSR